MISNFKLQHSLLESLQRNAASLNTDWKEFLENHLAIGIRRLKMLTLFDPVIPVIGINPEGIIESKVKDGHTRICLQRRRRFGFFVSVKKLVQNFH